MQGPPSPHPGAVRSTIVCSSTIDGSRQSQWPAKHPLLVVPSLLVPSFSVPRKVVKAVPSGRAKLGLQSYSFPKSWTLPSSVFRSHWSPVSWSVTAPSGFTPARHAIPAAVACAFRIASLASNFVWHFAGSAGLACSVFPFSVAWHSRSLPHSFSFLARQAGVVGAAPAGLTPPTSTGPQRWHSTMPVRAWTLVSLVHLFA